MKGTFSDERYNKCLQNKLITYGFVLFSLKGNEEPLLACLLFDIKKELILF